MNFTTDPTEPTATKKKPIIIGGIAAAVVIVAVIIGIVAAAGGNKQSSDQNADQANSFKNWLQPAQEIKVGDYRYVSPCQAFPISQAQKIFGSKFTAKTNVVEAYADKSLAADQQRDDSLTTKCTYRFNGEDGGSISLEVYPFYTKDAVTDFSTTVFPPNSQTEKIVDRFATANKDAAKPNQDFISKLRATQNSFNDRSKKLNAFINEQAKQHAGDADQGASFDINAAIAKQFPTDIKSFNGSLAAGASLQETGGDYGGAIEFLYKYNNAYYSLNYIPAKQDRKTSYDQYTDAFLKDITGKFDQSFNTIAQNISNNRLNQSPAPTIIGDSDTYGSTKLLEACSVADGASYTSLFGSAETQPVERSGYTRNAADIVKSGDVSDKIKYNQCNRSIKNVTTNQDKTMKFTLFEGPDAKTTEQWDKDQKADDDDTVTRTNLQTNADSASVLTFNDDPTIASYRFKVGNYVGGFYPTDGDNTTSAPVSQDAAVKAINIMVANLKRDMAAAK